MRQEHIRKEILMQCYASRPLALGGYRIARDAAKAGYDYTRLEVDQELDFLEGEGLIALVPQPGSALKVYKISSGGVRHYEQNFQA